MAPLVWPQAAATDVRCLTSEELIWELASRIGVCGLTPMWAQSGALQDRLRALMDQAESRGIHPADVARRVVGMLRGRDAVPQQLPFAAEVAREMLRPFHLQLCVLGEMVGRLSPGQVWLKIPTASDPGAAHEGEGPQIWHFFSWTNAFAVPTWTVYTTCGCSWSHDESWPFSFVGLSLLGDSATTGARFIRLASLQMVLLTQWNQFWTGTNMHMELGLRPPTIRSVTWLVFRWLMGHTSLVCLAGDCAFLRVFWATLCPGTLEACVQSLAVRALPMVCRHPGIRIGSRTCPPICCGLGVLLCSGGHMVCPIRWMLQAATTVGIRCLPSCLDMALSPGNAAGVANPLECNWALGLAVSIGVCGLP